MSDRDDLAGATVAHRSAGAAQRLAALVDGVLAPAPMAPSTVDVASERWHESLQLARDRLEMSMLDWITAVDEQDVGFSVLAHLAAVDVPGGVNRLLVRTRVPRERPRLSSVVDVFPAAGWHERETADMFGVEFTGHPGLRSLLLPDGFTGHPLRKEFELVERARVLWPGAADPAARPAHPGQDASPTGDP